MSDPLSVAVGWATIISAVATVVGIPFGLWALTQARLQRRGEFLTQLHDKLQGVEARRSLAFIYSTDPGVITELSDAEALARISYVLAVYDLLGLQVRRGLVHKEDVLASEVDVLLKLWPKVFGYVLRERKRRGHHYKEDLEWLVGEAETYWEKCYPNQQKPGCYVGDGSLSLPSVGLPGQ